MAAPQPRASVSIPSDRINKVFKILVLGDAGSGKTSLIKQYVFNSFEENSTVPTIGVDFLAKQIPWDEKTRVSLQIWDIPGSQKSSVITSTFYNFAMGALLVYDATIHEGLKSVLAWRDDVNSRICLPNGDFIPYVLLANKCDLEEAKVDTEILEQFTKDERFVGWYETSAKTGHNIEDSVRRLVAQILDIEEMCHEIATQQRANTVNLEQSKSRKKCCS
eukprot:TRINITY_DN2748_c0_g1_i1.p1 TRINITY_DN2748_c0_g1~~TRINITY_DN2748_c0_g1_i1.p1  ORF type:complete len:220 (+),score=50.62 TRINITY_DN2748_c0_g1_i1:56-715(+)